MEKKSHGGLNVLWEDPVPLLLSSITDPEMSFIKLVNNRCQSFFMAVLVGIGLKERMEESYLQFPRNNIVLIPTILCSMELERVIHSLLFLLSAWV